MTRQLTASPTDQPPRPSLPLPRLLKHLRPSIELGDNSPAITLLWLDFMALTQRATHSLPSDRTCRSPQ